MSKTQTKQFNGYTITDSGKVFRKDGIEVTGTKIGKLGHVIITLGGKTVYLARLVYCLFNGIEYDRFKGRIRYYGAYSDCSLKNLFTVARPERKESKPKRVIDSWEVRKMYCSGLSEHEIASMLHYPVTKIKNICLGFDNVSMEDVIKIIGIARK